MIIVNYLVFLLIIFIGTAAVFTRDPLKQSLILSLFGFIISILFLILQAPEVALSEIVVTMTVIPLMILLSMVKIKEYKIISQQDQEKTNE
ncbi:DUF4040 domain-containing protein [Legionella oakridgensis]|uniref:Putative, subunit of the multisubunit Na+/H+ antiporter n=2 Tax=Legionella oakridgensis TaxID=29423 RepID=W0BFL6_9GAMM|nr:DUF4040 domain-containing protein [Legionella oakridgensis]AHE67234.1 putative, subunit of the multisubunit Na+/H+ antiporter [Legionella oakridgensis ATCC 33761 = DSM 21215]ETO93197.1 putative, subunit of the multisubunit Na+/H+ antiporter [Legionella oakridgensis RV-2-2007]KTD37968.1 hypothetical protein Loak_1644 [Legionella oakridgensis]STY20311.1 putative monovalent cation/H+ antiporter subunit B [Legionella longbeachae]